MPRVFARHPFQVLSALLVAIGLVVAACATVDNPASPSETALPTLTITANGISQDVPFLVPGSPIRIVNNDTRAHRIHLDLGLDQPGCTAIENSGELAPGESRVTAPLGLDVGGCAVHDHMTHGDSRFAVRLNVDDIE
jgi:hypothetical protein